MMSPGWTALRETRGSDVHCADAECGIDTPACAHAHDVRPEQSKASGPPAPQTYGEPIAECAAAIAICAPEALGGGANPPPPPPLGGGADVVVCRAACSAASAAAR